MGPPVRPARYTTVARWYDVVSAEPYYRRGRRLAIPLLRLRPGDTVLDIGCGTGLNFPLLARALGPGGRLVGVDSSAQMLARARARGARLDPEVRLVRADATLLAPDELTRAAGGVVDAVIATYCLSLMPDWQRALDLALESARPGARVAVVDMQRPARAALRPLAGLAMAAGGADPDARPWLELERRCSDVSRATAPGHHVQVRVGTRP